MIYMTPCGRDPEAGAKSPRKTFSRKFKKGVDIPFIVWYYTTIDTTQ